MVTTLKGSIANRAMGHLESFKYILGTGAITYCNGRESKWKSIILDNGDILEINFVIRDDYWKVELHNQNNVCYKVSNYGGSHRLSVMHERTMLTCTGLYKNVVQAYIDFGHQILVLDKLGKFPLFR